MIYKIHIQQKSTQDTFIKCMQGSFCIISTDNYTRTVRLLEQSTDSMYG